MNIKTIVSPTEEPVSLAEAKTHLRVVEDQEDTLIGNLITAARRYCEGRQNRAYVTRTLQLSLDNFPVTPFELPRPPLREIVEIKYTDRDGVEEEVGSDIYVVDTDSFLGRITLKHGKSWPSVKLKEIGAVKIKYKAGYGEAKDVPQDIKNAMLLLIGHWFLNREATVTATVNAPVQFAVDALLGLDRVWNL